MEDMGRHLKNIYATDLFSLRRSLIGTYGPNGNTYQRDNTYSVNCVGFRGTCGSHYMHAILK